MDLTPRELAALALLLPVGGFFARWVWDRHWKKKDVAVDAEHAAEKARDAKVETIENRVQVVERRVDSVHASVETTAHKLGVLEATQNRLDGKVDGLQKHWTSRFDKLEDEMKEGFKSLNDKMEYKLDNLRLELRGDQQKAEEQLHKLLEGHRKGVHDRLNEATAAQAMMLNELIDRLVGQVEPKPSPATGGGSTS